MREGAQALLVARHGHLLFEQYARGSDAATLIDGGEMSGVLLAMLAGIAQSGRPPAQLDTTHWDPAALQSALAPLADGHYERYLSQQLWQPLNAAAGRFAVDSTGQLHADCCFSARAVDWLRAALLLTQQGRSEGEQLVPAAWIASMQRPVGNDPTRGFGLRLASRGFAIRNVLALHGTGHTRLWLAPTLQLAVLRVDADTSRADWSESTVLDPLIRAVRDRASSGDAADLLDQLVPGH
jgi:hypothetical protein